jgi:hypothetical protein
MFGQYPCHAFVWAVSRDVVRPKPAPVADLGPASTIDRKAIPLTIPDTPAIRMSLDFGENFDHPAEKARLTRSLI